MKENTKENGIYVYLSAVRQLNNAFSILPVKE